MAEESTLWDLSVPVTYLERKLPYLHSATDGLLFSAIHDLNSTTSRPTELTPEFFSEPSFLLGNHSREPVILPRFASDPYLFVTVHRRTLESDEVSVWLPKWIDSIFGVDSRAVTVSQGLVSDSTLHTVPPDGQDQWHVKLFDKPHPPRVPQTELNKPCLFDKTHRFSTYEPIDSNASEDILLLCISPISEEIACFTRSRMIVYDNRIRERNDKSDHNQGLTIIHEASLNTDHMGRLGKHICCDWTRMSLFGVSRSEPGVILSIELAPSLCFTTPAVNSSITALTHLADRNLLLVGSASGELASFSTRKEKLFLQFRIVFGGVLLLHKVPFIHPDLSPFTFFFWTLYRHSPIRYLDPS